MMTGTEFKYQPRYNQVMATDRTGLVELGRTTGRIQKEGQIFLGKSGVESHTNLKLMKDKLDVEPTPSPHQRRVREMRAADKQNTCDRLVKNYKLIPQKVEDNSEYMMNKDSSKNENHAHSDGARTSMSR